MDPETSDSPLWVSREIMLHPEEKTVAISVICKGKCFYVNLSPGNFDQTPNILQKYLKSMEDVNNDDDFDVLEEAEQDLQDWVMEPPSDQHRVTLQDYLTPLRLTANKYMVKTVDCSRSWATLCPPTQYQMASPSTKTSYH